MKNMAPPPVVLVIAGNDPSGGAGICADTQTVTRLGCHPAPVLSSLTVQDTINAHAIQALSPDFVRDQAECVLNDLPVRAIKLGLLSTPEIGATVARLLERHRDIPVVTDPVLVAAGGATLAEEDLVAVYRQELLPRTTVLTPNAFELRRMTSGSGSIGELAMQLHQLGSQWVVAKGGDEDTLAVENLLFNCDGLQRSWQWERLPREHHGSGCTLASAIAAFLARGENVLQAVDHAQQFTFEALAGGWQLGRGQNVPNRHHRLDR